MTNVLNNDRFLSLSKPESYSGSERKVGFELEYSGLNIQQCANIVCNHYGGTIELINPIQTQIRDTSCGTFTIELDSDWLQKVQTTTSRTDESGSIAQIATDLLNTVAEQIVPFEIVTPPIALGDLSLLEELREDMRISGAKGSGSELHNAFGMHINPEVHSFDANYLSRLLKSFLLLYPWLISAMEIDYTRRILTYIDPFKQDFFEFILDREYCADDVELFGADYIKYNPTRNRALDMLPLLSHLKVNDISKAQDQNLIKSRPTFHYRLPNCEIEKKDWRIAHGWNSWVLIEQLADDKQKFDALEKKALAGIQANPYPSAKFWKELVLDII